MAGTYYTASSVRYLTAGTEIHTPVDRDGNQAACGEPIIRRTVPNELLGSLVPCPACKVMRRPGAR